MSLRGVAGRVPRMRRTEPVEVIFAGCIETEATKQSHNLFVLFRYASTAFVALLLVPLSAIFEHL